MKTIVVAPDPALLESMRSIGYTIESAVADVIDNSVAANASNVEILFSSSGPFEIAVVDDGNGMSRDEAVTAMRLAATSPRTERRPEDLGRFGLGLKTASLSQCRTLTLASEEERGTGRSSMESGLRHRRQGTGRSSSSTRANVAASARVGSAFQRSRPERWCTGVT